MSQAASQATSGQDMGDDSFGALPTPQPIPGSSTKQIMIAGAIAIVSGVIVWLLMSRRR